MKPYIFGRKNLIHIIDLRATLTGLIRGANLVKNVAARGEFILFVGTKRQARSVVLEEALRAPMPYVAERWLGGTLTNFMTIRSRLKRLDELEEMEESGEIRLHSKKEVSRFRRELQKLHRNLGGIRDMAKLPGALVVVDPSKEDIAVKEARKLEIPVVGLVDTDTDPELVDIVIPCNDDAFRSIKIILSRITDAAVEGKVFWDERRDVEQKARAQARPAARPHAQRRPRRREARPRRRSAPPRARSAPRPAKPADTATGAQLEKKPEFKPEEKTEPEKGAQEAQTGTQTS